VSNSLYGRKYNKNCYHSYCHSEVASSDRRISFVNSNEILHGVYTEFTLNEVNVFRMTNTRYSLPVHCFFIVKENLRLVIAFSTAPSKTSARPQFTTSKNGRFYL